MKKKKLFLVGVCALLLMAYAGGCGNTTTVEAKTETTSNVFEHVRDCGHDVEEYRDSETGVHYFVFDNYYVSGGASGGICPRYNADGTLYVD